MIAAGDTKVILDQVPSRVRACLMQINNSDIFWFGTDENVDETTGFHIPHTGGVADGFLELFTTDKVYCKNVRVAGSGSVVIMEEFDVEPCGPIIKR